MCNWIFLLIVFFKLFIDVVESFVFLSYLIFNIIKWRFLICIIFIMLLMNNFNLSLVKILINMYVYNYVFNEIDLND